jgi:CMP-N,N'-diacetyllegionaminic acid synthase
MINNKKVLAVVTARANSQTLPGKNYKEMLGFPLFVWSVLSAMRSCYTDAVVISSNCEHVKKISLQLISEMNDESDTRFKDLIKCKNLHFLQRPDEYATAISKNEDSLIHAYNYAKESLGIDVDIIANLQPTSPIRDTKYDVLIDECLQKKENEQADSLFTVSVHTPFFVHKAKDGYVMNERTLLKNRPMRQELNPEDFFLHDCGNLYLTDVDVLLETNNRIGPNFTVYPLDEKRSLQIDTELDFSIVEQTMIEFLKL